MRTGCSARPCRLPGVATWLALRVLFGPGRATVAHLHRRFPGISPLTHAILSVTHAVDALFSYYADTPIQLLVPRLLFACAAALAALAPLVAAAAFGARAAWQACFMDARLTEQASVTDPKSFGSAEGISMQFGEGVWDLVRDFTADNNCRAAAAADAAVYAALAAIAPLWLLLLPPARAAAAALAVLAVLAIFGLLQAHWAAELALDSLACAETRGAAQARSSASGGVPSDRLAGGPSRGGAGIPAAQGTLVAACALCLLPSQLFLGSGHYCEFAGLQWTAAFVGFEDSVAVRSGALVAINTFAPHAVASLLLVLVATCELRAQMALLDAAAAGGHELQRPHRVSRAHTDTRPELADVYTLAGPLLATPLAVRARGRDQTLAERGAAFLRGPTVSLASRDEGAVLGRGFAGTSVDVATGVLLRGSLWLSGLAALFSDSHSARPGAQSEAAMFDPSWSPQQWHSGEMAHALFASVFAVKVAVAALELFCASLNAFIQRRHLMIWALFAPKWMFEVCFWAVGMAALAYAASLADQCVRNILPMGWERRRPGEGVGDG